MLSKRHANHRMGPDATPRHGNTCAILGMRVTLRVKADEKANQLIGLVGPFLSLTRSPRSCFQWPGRSPGGPDGEGGKGGAECAHSAGPSRATLHPETGMQRLHPHSPRRSPPPLVVFLFLPSSSSQSSLLHLVPLLRPSHQCPGPPPPTHSSS